MLTRENLIGRRFRYSTNTYKILRASEKDFIMINEDSPSHEFSATIPGTINHFEKGDWILIEQKITVDKLLKVEPKVNDGYKIF